MLPERNEPPKRKRLETSPPRHCLLPREPCPFSMGPGPEPAGWKHSDHPQGLSAGFLAWCCGPPGPGTRTWGMVTARPHPSCLARPPPLDLPLPGPSGHGLSQARQGASEAGLPRGADLAEAPLTRHFPSPPHSLIFHFGPRCEEGWVNPSFQFTAHCYSWSVQGPSLVFIHFSIPLYCPGWWAGRALRCTPQTPVSAPGAECAGSGVRRVPGAQ